MASSSVILTGPCTEVDAGGGVGGAACARTGAAPAKKHNANAPNTNNADRIDRVRMDFNPQSAKWMWTGAPRTVREKNEVLRGGRSPSGKPPDHGRGREARVANLRCSCLQSYGRRWIDRERPVDGLVAQVANLAGRLGGLSAMMMA